MPPRSAGPDRWVRHPHSGGGRRSGYDQAGEGRWSGYDRSGGSRWSGYDRRAWIVALLALSLVAALGITGAVLLAHRIGAGSDTGTVVRARQLSYRVPQDWRTAPGGPETSAEGVALDGVATTGRYRCGGQVRARATVGSTFLVLRDGTDARPPDAVAHFGPLFAASFYGDGASAHATAPAPLTVAGRAGSASLVTVTAAGSAGCPGLAGRLSLVAVPTSARGAAGGTGVLMLVIARDTAGGPATATPADDEVVAGILGSARVSEPGPDGG